jgi:hypothetical protein
MLKARPEGPSVLTSDRRERADKPPSGGVLLSFALLGAAGFEELA